MTTILIVAGIVIIGVLAFAFKANANFGFFVTSALFAAIAIAYVAAIFPMVSWTFCGVILPFGFAVIFAICTIPSHEWDKAKEFIFAALGAAAGGAFALYVVPMLVH